MGMMLKNVAGGSGHLVAWESLLENWAKEPVLAYKSELVLQNEAFGISGSLVMASGQ